MAAKRFELYMNFTIMFSLLLDQSLLQAEILNLDRYDSEFQIGYMICVLNDFFILFRAKYYRTLLQNWFFYRGRLHSI
jgi:hypothetical protein